MRQEPAATEQVRTSTLTITIRIEVVNIKHPQIMGEINICNLMDLNMLRTSSFARNQKEC